VRGSDVRRDFAELAAYSWNAAKHVCIGLDVDLARLPQHLSGDNAARAYAFAEAIVDSTCDIAGAYKPNASFFEALGAAGPAVLHDVIQHVHQTAPDVPVIVDAKRADIASSNRGSVEYLFEYLGADATTVHPYLGGEALRPFLDYRSKGIFVLCRTSNPGAGELQDLLVGGEPLFLHLAGLVRAEWNRNSNCGLVVGATYPNELATVRSRAEDLPLLIPGIGAQGGEVEATVRAACHRHKLLAFINISRSVIYASSGRDFADAARNETTTISAQIASVVSQIGYGGGAKG
jgi:orotidine-5'-phosphate decarboxylase